MNAEKLQQLQLIYHLETQIFQAQMQESELSQRYAQAKYDQRQCRSALAEYEGFSVKSLLDRVKGCREEKIEQYRRNLRNAEAELLQTQQALEQLHQKLSQCRAQRDDLPAPEAIRDWIGEDSAGQDLWMRLDAHYCAVRLAPLLEENLQALLTAQKVLRGDTLGEVLTFEEQQKRITGPDAVAEECKVWMERMKKALDHLDIPFALEPYYQNPAAFLASATKYTKFDRFSQAIEQVRKTQMTINQLVKKL